MYLIRKNTMQKETKLSSVCKLYIANCTWHQTEQRDALIKNYFNLLYLVWDRSSTMVKELCYKSEGRWFDPSSCQWILIDIRSFRSHYGPGVDLASNRNEYQQHFLGVKAAGA